MGPYTLQQNSAQEQSSCTETIYFLYYSFFSLPNSEMIAIKNVYKGLLFAALLSWNAKQLKQ